MIVFTRWTYTDPLVSLLIAALIGWNALKIVRETINILIEGMPRGMEVTAIVAAIEQVDGVESMHDLNVWSISGEHAAHSCHLVVHEDSLVRKSRPAAVSAS